MNTTHLLSLLFFSVLSIWQPPTLLGQAPNEDLSLRSFVSPKPKVLGIDPEASPNEIKTLFEEMHLPLEKQQAISSFVHAYVYKGMPEGLWVQEGMTTLYFFQNKLIRIDFSLTPSYTNFLATRQQLLDSLGERFSIEQSREATDDFLKAHLAGLQSGEYDERTEKEIHDALKRGNTFYHYTLADNKKELRVILSYSAPEDPPNPPTPKLILHYNFTNPMEELVSYLEANKAKILPE